MRNQLHPQSDQVPVTLRNNPQLWTEAPGPPAGFSRGFRVCVPAGLSGFSLVPVLAQPVFSQPPLALRLVFVQQLRRRQRRLFEFPSGLVVLPGVPLALAGRDHGDLVRPGAAVLALQLDALRARLVVDAAPVVAAASPAPHLPAVGAADPVVKHVSRKTLASADQLLDGVDAGAVAIRDVLGGPQLSAADLASFCGKTQ